MTFGPSARRGRLGTVAVEHQRRGDTMSAVLFEQHAIDNVVARLARRYAGRHDEPTVRRIVEAIDRKYQTANVHTFVPLLVEREARRVLDHGPVR
jgi:hypothetical protein